MSPGIFTFSQGPLFDCFMTLPVSMSHPNTPILFLLTLTKSSSCKPCKYQGLRLETWVNPFQSKYLQKYHFNTLMKRQNKTSVLSRSGFHCNVLLFNTSKSILYNDQFHYFVNYTFALIHISKHYSHFPNQR